MVGDVEMPGAGNDLVVDVGRGCVFVVEERDWSLVEGFFECSGEVEFDGCEELFVRRVFAEICGDDFDSEFRGFVKIEGVVDVGDCGRECEIVARAVGVPDDVVGDCFASWFDCGGDLKLEVFWNLFFDVGFSDGFGDDLADAPDFPDSEFKAGWDGWGCGDG